MVCNLSLIVRMCFCQNPSLSGAIARLDLVAFSRRRKLLAVAVKGDKYSVFDIVGVLLTFEAALLHFRLC